MNQVVRSSKNEKKVVREFVCNRKLLNVETLKKITNTNTQKTPTQIENSENKKGKKRSGQRSVFVLYPLPPPKRSAVVVFSFLPTSLPSALRSFSALPLGT